MKINNIQSQTKGVPPESAPPVTNIVTHPAIQNKILKGVFTRIPSVTPSYLVIPC